MSEKPPDWRSALEAVVEEKRRDLGPHPGLDDLVAYHAGELEARNAARLCDHLVFCPECARLLLELDEFAGDAAANPSSRFPAAVVPIARRRVASRRRWIVAAAAAAAAVLLVVWPRDELLPDYGLALEGATGPTRSTETGFGEEAHVFSTGSRLTLRLQPETAVDGPVEARAYLRRGGELQALSAATLEVYTTGVVSLQGVVGTDVHLPGGESELLLAVAGRGALPSRRRLHDELATGPGSRGRGWIGFREQIRVEDTAATPPPSGLADADDDGPWIEYAGCRTILVGPICTLPDDRRLTLWVRRHRGAEVRIEAGGRRTSYAATEAGDGDRYEVEVAPGATELVVELRLGETLRTWVLELTAAPEPPDWLVRARELYESGESDELRRLLEPRISGPEPGNVSSALSLLARSERWSGNAERGDEYYRRALAAHQVAGRLMDQVRDACGFSYYLIREKRFSPARELLDSLPVEAMGGAAEARYSVAYHRGLLADEMGGLRLALAWMARAAREAERAGMIRRQLFAEDLLVLQLNTLGQFDAAAAVDSRMQQRLAELCSGESASPLTACDCARFQLNRAWTALLALEAGRRTPGLDPSVLLADVERFFTQPETRSCAAGDDLANVRLNRALAALHEGDPEAARSHLERARFEPEQFPSLALWQLDVEARIHLADSQPERALALYDELGRLAQLGSSPEAAWRAAFGRASALESQDRPGEAVEACEEAERLLDQESLLVPAHAGRERFIAARDRASRFCLELLLRSGREEDALALVRRSSARALRHLRVGARLAELDEAERNRWQEAAVAYREVSQEIERLTAKIGGLPLDEEELLREQIGSRRQVRRGLLDLLATLEAGAAPRRREPAPPAAGTLVLAYHPLPRGWAALAAGDDRVSARRVELTSPAELSDEELAARLLEPFAGSIFQAAEIRILPYGALRRVDFHALPLAGGILLDHAPVVYPLELPDTPAETRLADRRALVVSGPGLRAASAEARHVRSVLESPPGLWRVELLEGTAATASEVRRELPDVTLFHYAGHADFDEDSRGWNSHMALDGGGRLSVDDILASPEVPRWVVLAGCETGLDSPAAPLPSIGLAQAFLVAGAEAVVAATEVVDDEHTAALMEAFYRYWESSTSIAEALRKAQLEIRAVAPESGWREFRVLAR